MGARPVLIRQADATRLLKAAKAAGYARARLTRYPDGRVEVVGEEAEVQTEKTGSAFLAQKLANARS